MLNMHTGWMDKIRKILKRKNKWTMLSDRGKINKQNLMTKFIKGHFAFLIWFGRIFNRGDDDFKSCSSQGRYFSFKISLGG